MSKFKKVGISIFGIIAVLTFMAQIGGSMTNLKHEIQINKSKDKVFDVLATLDKVAEYNPTVLSAKYISSKTRGVGSERECDLGKQGRIKERVTAFTEGESISFELYEHGWPLKRMVWTTRVRDDGDKTVLTNDLTYEMKFGLLGSLMNAVMMKGMLNKTLGEGLSNLKDYLEK